MYTDKVHELIGSKSPEECQDILWRILKEWEHHTDIWESFVQVVTDYNEEV